jgi:hypothetical protein
LKPCSSLSGVGRWPFYIVLSLVTYLSIRPAPEAASVPFIPRDLGFWFDRHDFIRNLLGFGCLALAGFANAGFAKADALPARLPRLGTVRLVAGRWLAGMLGIVVLLEVGQALLPRRTPHWQDVAAGWLAILIVWGVHCALRGIRPVHLITPAEHTAGPSTGFNP